MNRRLFLASAGAGAVAAGALGAAVVPDAAGASAQSGLSDIPDPTSGRLVPQPGIPAGGGTLPAVPFHGPHQAGITTPKPPAAVFAAFDVTAETGGELRDLLQEMTSVARFLTAGGPPRP